MQNACDASHWHAISNVILNRNQKAESAEDIYNALRPYCGKRGYEMRRTCGSSGNVTSSTDVDLLSTLHEHEGSLPRSVHGVIIIRGQDRYHLFYRRANPPEGSSLFGYAHYCPPKDGGSFNMPPVCVSKFPMLADVSYNKMMCILLLM